MVGFGHKAAKRGRGQVLTAEIVDELWAEYESGESSKRISNRHYERLGYVTAEELRMVIEHAWKRLGRTLRSSSEATILARQREDFRRCKSEVSMANQRHRPTQEDRRCPHAAAADADYCWWHDPRNAEEVASRMKALWEKRLKADVAWADLLPYLAPLLVPRPDPKGRDRPYETAGGALARKTGVPGGTCCRLMLGRKEFVTAKLANRLLLPLGLTVADVAASREQREEEGWLQRAA
jgi:hypothetical protein